MRAGRLNRRIKFERRTLIESTVIGAPTNDWAKLRYAWADKVPLNGAEVLQFARETSGEVAEFIVRYNSDITPTDRINEDGKIWDILAMREIGVREGLRITAEARA